MHAEMAVSVDVWFQGASGGCRTNPRLFLTNSPQFGHAQETGRSPPTFFALDEQLAFIPSAILGLQHCLAMLIGLITPAAIMGGSTDDPKTRLYMINASMIVAGFMTIVQSLGIKHPRLPFQWGAGVLSVMGAPHASSERDEGGC